MEDSLRIVLSGLAAALSFAAPAAEAASVTYSYIGRDMLCGRSCAWHHGDDDDPMVLPPITGTITFDLAMFPRQTLAGARMTFEYQVLEAIDEDTPYATRLTLQFERPGESFFTTRWYSYRYPVWDGDGGAPDWSFAGVPDYSYPFLYSSIRVWAGLALEFDARSRIVAWNGRSMEGGSSDQHSFSDAQGNGYDGDDAGVRTDGPGRWLLTAPVPVPLPATAPLVLGGIGAIGLLRRRAIRRRVQAVRTLA